MTRTSETSARPLFVGVEASATAGSNQIILVPGVDTPLISLELPSGVRGMAREQIARRQLADHLGLGAGTIQMRPFAPKGMAETWTRVLIADPNKLSLWKGLQAKAVIPDYLSLPCAPDIWSLGAAENGTILARLGTTDGFSAYPALVLQMLNKALTENALRPKAIYLLDTMPDIAEWAHAQEIPLARTVQELVDAGLSAPTILGHDELSCDLRADPLAARAKLARQVLPWRWPILAGVLAAALFGAVQVGQSQKLRAQTSEMTAQIHQQVRRAFPDLGPILDIRLQVSRALADRRAAASPDNQLNPVELGRRVAQVLHEFGAVPQQLSYVSDDGILLALRLRNFAATEDLTRAFQQSGLAVELIDSSASTDAQGVRAEYRVRQREDQR